MSTNSNRNEEFKKLARLMWDNKGKLQVEPSNDKTSIKIWFEDRGYLPEAVFQGLFDVAAKQATKDDNGKEVPTEKAIEIFHQLRSELHSLIVAINIIAEDNKIEHKKDYADIFRMIDSFANWAVAELDSKHKSDQIKTNKRMTWILIVSILVAAISAWEAMRTADNEESDNILKYQLNMKDKEILLKNTKLQILGRQKDSLEILLLKKLSEPQER